MWLASLNSLAMGPWRRSSECRASLTAVCTSLQVAYSSSAFLNTRTSVRPRSRPLSNVELGEKAGTRSVLKKMHHRATVSTAASGRWRASSDRAASGASQRWNCGLSTRLNATNVVTGSSSSVAVTESETVPASSPVLSLWRQAAHVARATLPSVAVAHTIRAGVTRPSATGPVTSNQALLTSSHVAGTPAK